MLALQQAIRAWDGKSASVIQAVFQNFNTEPDFIDQVILLLPATDCQKGATWLIKATLESGKQLSQDHVNTILKNLNRLTHWESKLHVLQCLSYFTIAQEYRDSVEQCLRTTLADNNKFVRAWAYNGFYVLAKQYPAYQTEAQALFEMAMRDESAAIKARVRAVIKAGF